RPADQGAARAPRLRRRAAHLPRLGARPSGDQVRHRGPPDPAARPRPRPVGPADQVNRPDGLRIHRHADRVGPGERQLPAQLTTLTQEDISMRDVHTVAPASGPRPAQRREQMVWKACAWCGPLFVVMIVVVWMWLGRWFPPPHEDWDPPTLLRFYADNSVRIRLGMGGTVYVSIFFLLWTMAIARVMRELEGTSFPPLTILQICGGVG